MWDLVIDWITQNAVLTAVLGLGLGLLLLAAIVSAAVGAFKVYLGVGAVMGGCAVLMELFANVSTENALFSVALAAVFGGGSYLIAYLTALIVKVKRKRKDLREQAWRQLQFTLPDRENTYIRARLHTTLRTEEPQERNLGGKTEFSYAKSLLAKVREAELSATDKLQAEELGGLFALYGKKERLQTADMQVVNDGFAILLKLAAKYAVLP